MRGERGRQGLAHRGTALCLDSARQVTFVLEARIPNVVSLGTLEFSQHDARRAEPAKGNDLWLRVFRSHDAWQWVGADLWPECFDGE